MQGSFFVSGSVWDLSSPNDCSLINPGHWVFHVHFAVSMREPSLIIPVTAVVGDDDRVHLSGQDVGEVLWNHDPRRYGRPWSASTAWPSGSRAGSCCTFSP